MKRFVMVCAGSIALALGLTVGPLTVATAATGISSNHALQVHHGKIGLSHRVNLRKVPAPKPRPSTAAPQFLAANPSLLATERAAAVRSGGLRNHVASLAAPTRVNAPSAGGLTINDFPAMSQGSQVAAFGASDELLQPPDTQVAAGPSSVLEVVNDSISVWSKSGTLIVDGDLNAFFGVPTGFLFSDPRDLYDAETGVFFMSGLAYDASNNTSITYLAVSQTSDPTGNWIVYLGVNPAADPNTGIASGITDQPMIGVCDDKVVMSWNDFSNSTTFTGAPVLVIQKSSVIAGSGTVNTVDLLSGGYRPVPAQSLSPTTTCWVTLNEADSALPGGSTTSPTLGVIAITGTPDANNVVGSETFPSIRATSPPPDPRQPSGVTNDTQNDDRLISAVWQDGVLWTTATDACTPAGDTTTRDCMRLISVSAPSPGTTSVQTDEDIGSSGLDQYYPAVSLDSSGHLYISYTSSSSTQFPGAYAVISPDSSATFTAPLTIQAGSASYSPSSSARWGDYSAAAPDPSLAGAMWVAGEYAPSDAGLGDWGTAAAEVSYLPSDYTPVGPVRMLDTRVGTGTGGVIGPVGPGGVLSLQVAGVDGVPKSGVTAVVLNVTAVTPTASGYVTVYPDGQARPLASNLNFTSGEVIPNLVTVAVGSDGKVDFYNFDGSVHLVADLAGYYSMTGSPFGSISPVRVLDTRAGTGVPAGAVGPDTSISLQVAGVDGVPATGVTAVVLNVTAVTPTASGYVTVYPDGGNRPLASNLNFTSGEVIPNLVIVPVGSDGKVDFYNFAGDIHLVADLAGYYGTGGDSSFDSISPVRMLDTRAGTGVPAGAVLPNTSISLQVAGVDGVPATGVTAVVLNVTAVTPTASGYVTVYPDGGNRPLASNLNFTPGEVIPNLVIVPVGSDGKVDFYNFTGDIHLVADLAGYYTRPKPTTTTSTTLTASATSVAQDSWVTLQAQVTSETGTPVGSVTFSDASNGSILGTSTLVSGTATLTTAALAPGTRQLMARYGGSSSSPPSSSPDLTISVAQGSDAVTYQVDPAHDGSQAFGALSASTLTQKWKVTLGGTGGSIAEAGDVSYPVIAGGRVFVTVENTQTYGTNLYALDASTGATDWSVSLAGTYGFSALAYNGHVIFALNYDGLLTAFSASTGQELWATQMPGQWAFTAPPTAYDGVVYVSGAGSGGYVYAVREADGLLQWEAVVANGDKSSPAVDDSGAYVSYACQQDYRFSLSGSLAWHHTTSCEGGGGSTAVLHGADVYARGAHDTPLILSKSVGASSGTFASQTAPAFDSNSMYTINNGNLVAVDPSGSPDRWSFGDGTLVTAPVVAGGAVFVGSSTGTVYAVSANTGQQIWTGVAGSVIVGPDEQNADVLVGMAVGDGLLVVPAGNALVAFGS